MLSQTPVYNSDLNMGQITVFEKDNCVYCKRVIKLLEDMVQSLITELREEMSDEGPASSSIDLSKLFTFQIVDTKSESAYAALCIRLTGMTA